MATSGTYTFAMTRDTLIAAALRVLEVYGAGDTVQAIDYTNCAEALNLITKSLALKGLPLWSVQDIPVAMVAGQASYNLGVGGLAGNTLRPLRILQAYLRDSTGNDVTLKVESRYDYNDLGLKTSQSRPNQLYYDPQIGTGIVTLYNVPQDATTTLHVVIQRQLQDFTASGDNPDVPQEAFQMLKWLLADEISMEYGAKPHIVNMVAAKAKFYREELIDFEQEQSSIYFTPTERQF